MRWAGYPAGVYGRDLDHDTICECGECGCEFDSDESKHDDICDDCNERKENEND